jgi:hypothetical protein
MNDLRNYLNQLQKGQTQNQNAAENQIKTEI